MKLWPCDRAPASACMGNREVFPAAFYWSSCVNTPIDCCQTCCRCFTGTPLIQDAEKMYSNVKVMLSGRLTVKPSHFKTLLSIWPTFIARVTVAFHAYVQTYRHTIVFRRSLNSKHGKSKTDAPACCTPTTLPKWSLTFTAPSCFCWRIQCVPYFSFSILGRVHVEPLPRGCWFQTLWEILDDQGNEWQTLWWKLLLLELPFLYF